MPSDTASSADAWEQILTVAPDDDLAVDTERRSFALHEAIRDQYSGKVRRAASGNALQKIVEGMLGQVAIVDAEWQIVAANAAWIKESNKPNLEPRLRIGQNYKQFREWTFEQGWPEAKRLLDGIIAMDEGRTRQVVHSYASLLQPGRYYHLSISRFDVDGVQYGTISRFDMSELFELRRQRLQLGASLLRAQEEERQRVARDLHDTAAQFLVAMNLGLLQMQQVMVAPAARKIADELSELLDHFHRDLRGLTYLLHPPELQRGGLYAAIDMLCRGFARRTGLEIELKSYGSAFERTSTAESTIYRVCQEALSNIHKHAQARHVRIRLGTRTDVQYVLIEDDGCGLRQALNGTNDAAALGVGIPGMIARVHDLGGRLSVHNRKDVKGTMVAAALPVQAGSSFSAAA